jgi:ATP-dependent Clp protease ATP-binding subunit ClpA
MVEEPDTESAISILRGIKKIQNIIKSKSDDAIIAAVELSQVI